MEGEGDATDRVRAGGNRSWRRQGNFISLVRHCLAGFAGVAGQHVELARQELTSDLRAAGRCLIGVGAGLLLGQCGLLLTGAAASLFAARILEDTVLGFLLVGGSFLVVGSVVLLLFWQRLRTTTYLVETRSELWESKRWLQEEVLSNQRGSGNV